MPDKMRVITSKLVGERAPGDWKVEQVECDLEITQVNQSFQDFLSSVVGVLTVPTNGDATIGTTTGATTGTTTVGTTTVSTTTVKTPFLLEEVQITAEIGADGRFRLVGGTSAEGRHGGMLIKLRRQHLEGAGQVVEIHLQTPHGPLSLGGDTVPVSATVSATVSGAAGLPIQIAGGPLDVVIE